MPPPGDILKFDVPGGQRDFGNPLPGRVTPIKASFEHQLFQSSKELQIQTSGTSTIANLVQAAQRTKVEQGAYIVLQYSKERLFYAPAAPASSSAIHIQFSVAPVGNIRLVPTDKTLQIIGTVHTHYADVAAMNAANPGVRHTIAPQVSDQDRESAKKEKFMVYAVDANYVHKAYPNGKVSNKLSRNLDILVDALESYGKA